MIFNKEELINKNGKSYPVVVARLRVAHEENEHLEIITDVISFEAMDQAVGKVMVKSDREHFSLGRFKRPLGTKSADAPLAWI